MTEYVLHTVNPAMLNSNTRWQRYAVLEYTTFGDEKHLTNCRYFDNKGDAERYKAARERATNDERI